jgi:hypothetical protein
MYFLHAELGVLAAVWSSSPRRPPMSTLAWFRPRRYTFRYFLPSRV